MNTNVSQAAVAVRDRTEELYTKGLKPFGLLLAGYVAQPVIGLVQNRVTDPLLHKIGEAAKGERGQQVAKALEGVSLRLETIDVKAGKDAVAAIASNRKVQVGAGLTAVAVAATLVARRRNS